MWTEFPFIQNVSGPYTSQFLDTDELKITLRARKVSGGFEKQVPGRGHSYPIRSTNDPLCETSTCNYNITKNSTKYEY